MKRGIVLLIGRPNAGKSTLLNNILGRKVSITSPKPQTTRFPIQAVFEDERGQIVFIDTPGIFGRAHDTVSKKINANAVQTLDSTAADLTLYLIDHTRDRDYEENKTIGIVRSMKTPKILVINKIDKRDPSFIEHYLFLKEEFNSVVEVSAKTGKNLNILLEIIFSYLPEGIALVDTKDMVQPGINIDSKTFIGELIREKAYINLRNEIPYTIMTIVDEVSERENGTLYIKARIITNDERYKGMIVGSQGFMIRQLSMETRKELEVASDKKVFLDLTVDVDPHWTDYL